eukprot:1445749-Rhodomonas_salina.2
MHCEGHADADCGASPAGRGGGGVCGEGDFRKRDVETVLTSSRVSHYYQDPLVVHFWCYSNLNIRSMSNG